MTGARILASIPLILTGQVLTTLGHMVAGTTRINPHNRRSS